jgi:hypothetical protein
MSNLIICNHCQEIFKQENTTQGQVTGFWNEDVSMDLCGECKSKLDDWMYPEESKILKDWIKKDKKHKRAQK